MEIKFDAEKVLNNLIRTNTKVREAILLYGQTAGKKLEGHAKAKASWKDRTSNARNSITASYGFRRGVAGQKIDYNNSPTGKELTKLVNSDNISMNVGGDTDGDIFVIALSGGEEYSPFLELAHKKKYAILWKTVNAKQAEIIEGWAAMLRKLR